MNAIVESRARATFPVDPEADDPRSEIRTGAIVAFAFFVVMLGGAAFVPLDAGAYGSGNVAVSGNRQSVQHREGGVVTALHVREGDRVRKGQVLVEMAAPDLRASERAMSGNYLTLLAQRSRLMAESSGAGRFAAPPEFADLSPEDQPLAERAMRLQTAQFQARAGSLAAQKGVLGQRSRQLDEQRGGYAEQRAALVEQQRIIAEELAGLRELAERGFASKNRVRELERAQAALKGQEAAMAAEMARAAEGMGESRMQSLSLSQSMREEVAADLRDTEVKLQEVLPKLVAIREQLRRATVRAPASGQVVGLSVFTVGGVVTPGQTLMDIVPDNKALVIEARVSPDDASELYRGQKVQVRFPSVPDRTLPILTGRLVTVSADSFFDERAGRPFFRTEVEVPPAELQQVRQSIGRGELRSGLPVEIVIPTRKRTALQYILEPLTGSFWKSFREQ
ncbi:Type I secretion system membrane fusion protein PrsE [Tsuneonella dongtanensis]|uniref:Membrane fusion protein (MFP) family protein n=1 Tax=Tsuneonella dongtanensis TaxID=692370 RepID=A0A1B2AGF9_9SPHN|nr:HlyD family type I secretion periplasmic adaptor subunit [Tsuneonella dongtanensis]ANY21198.1 Type I secretion system membrane fusion protein PrsE [Tsuneonella dongtanensis]